MSCKHLREIIDTCEKNGIRLSSSDVIRIVCPTCGAEEVCPTMLCEHYEATHGQEDHEETEAAGPDK